MNTVYDVHMFMMQLADDAKFMNIIKLGKYAMAMFESL